MLTILYHITQPNSTQSNHEEHNDTQNNDTEHSEIKTAFNKMEIRMMSLSNHNHARYNDNGAEHIRY
jgi:hypothetical protein